MVITKFNNGNFRVKREWGDDENLIVALCNSAELDFTPLGEEYCLGNALGMAQDLYNWNTGKTYMITHDKAVKWKYMRSIYITGYPASENELAQIYG